MAWSRRIVAMLRDEPGERIVLIQTQAEGTWFEVEKLSLDRSCAISMRKDEFVALMRAGLEALSIPPPLVESVLPKLSKANVVK